MLISPNPETAATGTHSSHIMLVEPDPHVRAVLGEYLRNYGYSVAVPAGINIPWSRIHTAAFDVLVVNPASITQNASAAQRRLAMADIPAIALGGLDEDLNRLSRFGCQFHARLRYPVQPRKLLVTIRRVIIEVRIASGLPEKEPAREFRFAGWTLYADLRQIVSREGKTIRLGEKEHRVLKALLTFPNQALSREQLIEVAFRSDKGISARSVETAIHRLRHHLGDDARFPGVIKTFRGVGYMLGVPVEKVALPAREKAL